MSMRNFFSLLAVVFALSQAAAGFPEASETPRADMLRTFKAIRDFEFEIECNSLEGGKEFYLFKVTKYNDRDIYFASLLDHEALGWTTRTEIRALNLDDELQYADSYKNDMILIFEGNGKSTGRLACHMWTGAY